MHLEPHQCQRHKPFLQQKALQISRANIISIFLLRSGNSFRDPQMLPAKEVEALRQAWFQWPVSTLKNQQTLMAKKGEAMKVLLHWDCAKSDAEQYGLSLGEGLRVYVDTQMQRLVLERRYLQYGLCGMCSVPLVPSASLALRMFIDSSSVEVFVNDGEACISNRIYPDADRRELILFSWHGTAILSDAGVWQPE